MQNGFLNEDSEHVIAPIIKLIDECGRRKIPTIYTKFINSTGSVYEELMGWTNLRQEPETALHDLVSASAEVIIEKSHYTALTRDFFALESNETWEKLIICGVSTESCVLKTAADAFEREFRPIVLTDACASDLGEDKHRMGLSIIEILIGKEQLMTVDQLLNSLA